MAYATSFAVGLGVGLIYFLVRVNSPAPPLIALIGLLGMVCGEHLVPTLKTILPASLIRSSQTDASVGARPDTHMPGWVPAKSLHEARRALADARDQANDEQATDDQASGEPASNAHRSEARMPGA
jgi:XapX domain-containing protein